MSFYNIISTHNTSFICRKTLINITIQGVAIIT